MKIHEILRKIAVSGDVGIELEMEGSNLPFYLNQGNRPISISAYWSIVHDGSLRDGAEYLLTKPLSADKVPDALREMQKMMDEAKSRPAYSFRTSTHVHVNVSNMEYKKVLNFLYLYSLLESLITNVCGERRVGNRFCLRISDAEGCLHVLMKLISANSSGGRGFYRHLAEDAAKYSAMNVVPMGTKGSVEFRAMEGHNDWERLCRWVDTLLNLRLMAEEYEDIPAIWEDLNVRGATSFARKVLMERYEDYLGFDVQANILESASLSYDLVLSYLQSLKKKEEGISQPEAQALLKMWLVNSGLRHAPFNDSFYLIHPHQLTDEMRPLVYVDVDREGRRQYVFDLMKAADYCAEAYEAAGVNWRDHIHLVRREPFDAVMDDEIDHDDEDDDEE